MDMDIWYDWRFREPGEMLGIHMSNYEEGKKLSDATLTLRRNEINSFSLNRALLVYPFMTVKVTTMIYLQALRLWSKGAVFYVHPDKRKGIA